MHIFLSKWKNYQSDKKRVPGDSKSTKDGESHTAAQKQHFQWHSDRGKRSDMFQLIRNLVFSLPETQLPAPSKILCIWGKEGGFQWHNIYSYGEESHVYSSLSFVVLIISLSLYNAKWFQIAEITHIVVTYV